MSHTPRQSGAAAFRRWCIWLLVTDMALAAAHLRWPEYRWGQGRPSYFNFANPLTAASWLTGVQLAAVGLVALLAFARDRRSADDPLVRTAPVWVLGAAVVLFQSFAEISRLHVRLHWLNYPTANLYQHLVVLLVRLLCLLVFGWFLLARLHRLPLLRYAGLGWALLWTVGLYVSPFPSLAVIASLGQPWGSLVAGLPYLLGATLLLLAVGGYTLHPSGAPAAGLSHPAPFPLDLRRVLTAGVWTLALLALGLGVLHLRYADLRSGGVYWFNLDKEKNLPTWFSGLLFFLVGCMAFVAHYWERRRNEEHGPCFRLPGLWVVVGAVGLLLSLDEVTVLHENLFWRAIRLTTERLGRGWVYVTQWELVFAPVIVVTFGLLVVLFVNRFRMSRPSAQNAGVGLGCWLGGLCLEGTRGIFDLAGSSWYSGEVLVEEELEMFGALLLATAVAWYVLHLAADFTPADCRRLGAGSPLLTRRSLVFLGLLALALSVCIALVAWFAWRQAQLGAPLPRLFYRLHH